MGDGTAVFNRFLFGGEFATLSHCSLISRVAGHQVVLKQGLLLFRAALLGREHRAQRTDPGDRHHFGAGKLAIIDAHVLHTAIGEDLREAPLADARGRRGLDAALECVGLGFDGSFLTVDEDAHPACPAPAIIRDKDMLPHTGTQSGFGRGDFDGVLRPFADDVDGNLGVVLPEIPAAVAVLLVHARKDAAKDTGTSGADPDTITKSVIFFKVPRIADVKRAARFHHGRRAEFAIRLPRDFTGGLEGLRGSAGARDFAAGTFIERDVGHDPPGRHILVDVLRLRACQPFLKLGRSGLA